MGFEFWVPFGFGHSFGFGFGGAFEFRDSLGFEFIRPGIGAVEPKRNGAEVGDAQDRVRSIVRRRFGCRFAEAGLGRPLQWGCGSTASATSPGCAQFAEG